MRGLGGDKQTSFRDLVETEKEGHVAAIQYWNKTTDYPKVDELVADLVTKLVADRNAEHARPGAEPPQLQIADTGAGDGRMLDGIRRLADEKRWDIAMKGYDLYSHTSKGGVNIEEVDPDTNACGEDDGSMDVVLLSMCVQSPRRSHLQFDDAVRILKPGGVVIMVVHPAQMHATACPVMRAIRGGWVSMRYALSFDCGTLQKDAYLFEFEKSMGLQTVPRSKSGYVHEMLNVALEELKKSDAATGNDG